LDFQRTARAAGKVARSHRFQHAAVDEIGRTDAVGGLVGAEENEEVRELLGAGESLNGCVLVGDAL
jgi:hypothetical protein